ncbi:archemetzincin [Thermococcus profundus]|uniref:Archaemetzincin n=1 Tax=Thermococcus profundus TaxID=49899 RepID=A0A2Z2MBR0_THEPR|nr:archaemetzincin family Zn-dependent metalloprotease [Thermococcus profundus]ASJ03266.1 archemetzincin [Thermococcus profundus]
MILIVPIGGVERYVVTETARFVGEYYSSFGMRVGISQGIPDTTFFDAYNPRRRQFLGRSFLPRLASLGEEQRADAVLGITSLDLYEEGLNFIFGLAHPGLRAAVVSLHRLRPEFYGETPNETLLVERTVKEAMHELGHVFGLAHCPNVRCVMHFSNSIIDTDMKSPYYCDACRSKLEKNLEGME